MRPTPEHDQGLALPLQAWQAQARDPENEHGLATKSPASFTRPASMATAQRAPIQKKDGLRMTHVMSNVCGPQNTAT